MKDMWRISNKNQYIWNITMFCVQYKGKYPCKSDWSNAYYYTAQNMKIK